MSSDSFGDAGLPALYTVAIGRKQRGCIEIVFGSTPEWRDRLM